MTPDQFIALRSKIGTGLGFGSLFASFDGTANAYSELTLADQIKLTNAIGEYIRAHPAEFNPTQNALASNLTISAPENYTAAAAAGDFFETVANEAVAINESVNPFSAANRGWVLGAVVVGAAIYFLAPVVIAALRAPAGAAAK